jgi:hypothetical protein
VNLSLAAAAAGVRFGLHLVRAAKEVEQRIVGALAGGGGSSNTQRKHGV